MVTAYGGVRTLTWANEWYETATGDARRRAAKLRRLGYRVGVENFGAQVTSVGRVGMTLVSVGPGRNEDLENMPRPEREVAA